jgi:hypothetical protein
MKIPVIPADADPSALQDALQTSHVVLDALFGFSFKGPVRAPFDAALGLISKSGKPVVSVDVPSGWEVDGGRSGGIALEPDVLVSLTAPKEGVRDYKCAVVRTRDGLVLNCATGEGTFSAGASSPSEVYFTSDRIRMLMDPATELWRRSSTSTCRRTPAATKLSSWRLGTLRGRCERRHML